MPNYIVLARWTQHGIENIKESPARLDKVKAGLKAAGAKLKDFYMTMGRYDMVLRIEAPDDATLAKVMLSVGAQGSVQSQTLRAFNEQEYRDIIGSLP